MENNPEQAGGTAEAAGAEPMNFVQRLTGAYFEPKKTFDDISRRGGWLAMFILVSILTGAVSYVSTVRIDRETRIRKSFEMSPIKIPEEQKETLVKQQLERPPGFMERFGFVFAPVGVIILYLILAAVFLLMFVLMGGGLNFKKSLTISIWGMAPPGIIMTLLSILFMYVKDPDKLELDPSLNVASNLGILISDPKAHPALASLLGAVDVFSIWSIALLSIGFAAASGGKLTTKKASIGVLIPWAVYVLGRAAWKAIF